MIVANKNDFYADLDNLIVGIDEVGRGALSGPVVSCALILYQQITQEKLFEKITDSKKLSQKQRIEISKIIMKNSKFSLGISDNLEIDKYNILNATILSMKRAYNIFKNTNFNVKIDGVKTFELNDRTTFQVKGDQKSITIASASIVAKVYRDELMINLSNKYPHYGWEKNKGYGTKYHLKAIQNFGTCALHRKSFLKKTKPWIMGT